MSVSTPSAFPTGEAATPVAHRTTSQSIQSSPTFTRPGSMSVTKLFNFTSTPICSSCFFALSERSFANVPNTRSEPSKSITFAFVVSITLKSLARAIRAMSAIAPASSTPVGPPPTTTKFSERWVPVRYASRSASSNASKTRRRISRASSSVFRPGADVSQSSWPKYAWRPPAAIIR